MKKGKGPIERINKILSSGIRQEAFVICEDCGMTYLPFTSDAEKYCTECGHSMVTLDEQNEYLSISKIAGDLDLDLENLDDLDYREDFIEEELQIAA